MSNPADPASTAEFVYESISGHARVTVRARFLTERETIRHEELWKSARELRVDDPKFAELRDEMLSMGIVSPPLDVLKDTFSRNDLLQLALRYPDQVGDIELSLGKSRSRPQFTQVASAVDVAAPSAITPQAAPVTPPASTPLSS